MNLNKIQKFKIKTKVESLTFYRLGIFKNTAYELVQLNANQYYPPHLHKKSTAKLHIIYGSGIIILNKKRIKYKKGDVFLIKKRTYHSFKVKTPTLLFSIQKPPIYNSKSKKVDVEYIKKINWA